MARAKLPHPCPLCASEMHTVHDPFSNTVRHSCGCGFVEEPFSTFAERVERTGQVHPNGWPPERKRAYRERSK